MLIPVGEFVKLEDSGNEGEGSIVVWPKLKATNPEAYDSAIGATVFFNPELAFAIDGDVFVRSNDIIAIDSTTADATVGNRPVRFIPATVAQEVIFDDVLDERDYQNKKWGGSSFDDTQTEEGWVKYINEYASGEGRAANYDFRTRLVKVAALAFAAIESLDRQAGDVLDDEDEDDEADTDTEECCGVQGCEVCN